MQQTSTHTLCNRRESRNAVLFWPRLYTLLGGNIVQFHTKYFPACYMMKPCVRFLFLLQGAVCWPEGWRELAPHEARTSHNAGRCTNLHFKASYQIACAAPARTVRTINSHHKTFIPYCWKIVYTCIIAYYVTVTILTGGTPPCCCL